MPRQPSLRRHLSLALALSLTALACSFGAPPIPTTSVETPSAAPPTRVPATEAPTRTAGGTSEVTAAPATAILSYDWDDRTPFAAGLTADEQPALAALPGATIYHLSVTIDPSLTRVSGHLAVRYTNQEDAALREIVFRLYPNLLGGEMTLTDITVDGEAATSAYDERATTVMLGLPTTLDTGDSAMIEMDFDVTVPTSLERNYGVLASADGVLALAHFFPFVAVYDADGWNMEVAPEQGDVIYGDASFFIVQVQAPADLVLAGGGTVIGERVEAGQQLITYALGPARDFYLAASEAYTVTTGTAGPTTIRVYAPPAFANAAQETVTYAAAALELFAEHYGPYSYTELDLVSTPTYALGIEYPGIIALTNDLLDPGTSEAGLLEVVTAHEVGHQWFYNLVGNDQLDEPWLDEALTQYVTLQYFLFIAGPDAAVAFHDSLQGRWDSVGRADIPIGLPVAEYQGAEYSAIVYGRGPLFFEALAQQMGQPAFDTFLANYASSYRWSIATPAGLLATAEAACVCELDELFAAWGAE